MSDVTRLLASFGTDKPVAAKDLLPLVYDELRRLAAARLAQESPGQTLQPTALVHEAFLRLMGGEQAAHWDHRGHFFAAAAEAMRRILVENARRKRRLKHGGGRRRIDLTEVELADEQRTESLLALDVALERLAADEPEAAQVVELRYFAGLTAEQAAETLGISLRTANRHWAFAKAWLYQQLKGGPPAQVE
jgi:RNA polymerase sigma factor (TIGR02999 family)